MLNYPLKFEPISQYRLWGGERLKSVLGKPFEGERLGESWEISNVKGNETKVSNGHLTGSTLSELIAEYPNELLGSKVYERFGKDFPLLIKFIDAATPLSIQVHPNDKVASERHGSFGKNEMWFIMDAEDDAEIIVGFNQKISEQAFGEHLRNSSITDVMNKEKVRAGDAFNIPAGRVHAIGAGVLLAEIQQTSDVTYRIYDYDRIDAKLGTKRELHVELAKDVIDYEVHDQYKTDYDLAQNGTCELIHTPYFISNIVQIDGELKKDYSHLDSFVIYICLEGEIILGYKTGKTHLKKGETILLPASLDQVSLGSEKAKLIEVHL